MPERQQLTSSGDNNNDNNNNSNNNEDDDDDIQQQQQTKISQPMAKLVIEEPRVSDEALYKCDVTYVKGKCPSISLVRVQMLVLPEKAQIISNNNQHGTSTAATPSGEIIPDGYLIGPYNEHEQLKLTCLVYGGRPQPKSVIWRKIDASGRTINLMPLKYTSPSQSSMPTTAAVAATTTTVQPVTSIRQQSTLSVVQVDLNHTLTSSDLGAKFECHVEHEAIEQQPTARVVSSSSNNNMPSTETQGSTSPAAFATHPLHDSMLDLHPSRSFLQMESNPSSITDQMSGSETSSSSSSSGVLLSQTNSRFKSLDSHVFVDLNVGVSSLDLFMTKMNKRNSSEALKEGDLVELECVAYNSKPPANITWFNGSDSIEQSEQHSANNWNNNNNNNKQQQARETTTTQKQSRHKRLLQRSQVHQNADGQTFTTHSFLSIKLSRHEHRAQISCQAQNAPMRQPLVKSLELQVQHAPIVLMEPAAGIMVSESGPTWDNSNSNNNNQASERADNDVILSAPKSNHGADLFTPVGEVNIYCIYTANPTELVPNSTQWFKDGKPLTVTNTALNSLEQSISTPNLLLTQSRFFESITPTGYPILTIRHVNRRDTGLYDCQISNIVGTSERLPLSEACKVEVNFKPSVKLRIFKPQTRVAQTQAPQSIESFPMDELTELDINQELVLLGSTFVLVCDVIEAQPKFIQKYHWFKTMPAHHGHRQTNRLSNTAGSGQQQLISVTESKQFVLNSLTANFTLSSFTCTASNALGSSEQSNQVELQLSYTPGPSIVRPISDATLRSVILNSGSKTAHPVIDAFPRSQYQQPTVLAGTEFVLECMTPDLGQPRANIWLWFKNGQPIEATSSQILAHQHQSTTKNVRPQSITGIDARNNPDDITLNNHNPSISTGNGEDGSASSPIVMEKQRKIATQKSSLSNGHQPNSEEVGSEEHFKIKLIGSGRYLYIPSIQLAHKGNYSCVAVNRFGSGLQQQQQSSVNSFVERDSYQLRVALAPSFVQPLVSRTFWSEKSQPTNVSDLDHNSDSQTQLELVCHIQCEPICQIDWFKNNEPLDISRQLESPLSKYVLYQIRHKIVEENIEANLFRSVESRLVFQFSDSTNLSRDKILERRNLINYSNFTCQSSPNSSGPSVRSTTRLLVQYPPENVSINAPSDKLSFIEGSNGPRLNCEGSGEPQLQYRWFLLKSGNDLALPNTNFASKLSKQQYSNLIIQSLSKGVAAGGEEDAINQVASKAFSHLPSLSSRSSSNSRGANDVSGIDSENLIELVGLQGNGAAVVEQRGGSSIPTTSPTFSSASYSLSTLDLSNLSLDKRQTGHYICEASNALGKARQSVYVNVQYKPNCASLHLHSLDVTMAPSSDRKRQLMSDIENNYIKTKPFNATANDEYSLLHEASGDFVDLRKMLVVAPLLNRNLQGIEPLSDMSFQGSIFQTILNEKRNKEEQQQNTIEANRNQLYRDKDALLNTDETNEDNLSFLSNTRHRNNQSDEILVQTIKLEDYWDKFNKILLKFLNNYVKQVRTDVEQQTIETNNRVNKGLSNSRQNRRSSTSSTEQFSPREDRSAWPDGSSRNLLTFACMARDANPMSNLSFGWSFGSTNLPETITDFESTESLNSDSSDSEQEFRKPLPIYINENNTIQVSLIRRLDTKSSLNPFQMSLLTLDVVVAESLLGQQPKNQPLTRITRQVSSDNSILNRTLQNSSPRAPVIKKRHQSLYNSLKGNQNNNNNVQFAHDFDTKPFSLVPAMELTVKNWQEKIGNLLKCTVTNQIGTSDICLVRVNLAERLKSKASSEFAKWRMPSLAQKSLLIISVLIGCILIIFVTSALIFGPYIKVLNLSKEDRISKEETNTGQSTSSQKSSVLGLLGNGDSSLQGSSDDDSSARLHETRPLNNVGDTSLNRTTSNRYQHHNQLLRESNLNYDKPRGLQQDPSRLIYHPNQFNEMSREPCDIYQYQQNGVKLPTNQVSETMRSPESKTLQQESAGGQFLSNLNFKSLSKFRVDRISDLSNLKSRLENQRNFHTRNLSNTETNTTGLSASVLDSSELSMKKDSPNLSASPPFFGPSNLRRSHTGYKPPVHHQQQDLNNRQLDPSYYLHDQNGLLIESDQNLMQMSNSRKLLAANLTPVRPTYSNMGVCNQASVLDEFVGRRDFDAIPQQKDCDSFLRSHSVRNQTSNQPIYMVKNDLNYIPQQQPTRGPPVYPRLNQSSAFYNANSKDCRPYMRSPHKHVLPMNPDQQQFQPRDNRFSIPSYNQSFSGNGYPIPTVGYMNTIDSHLNRMVDNITMSKFTIQEQNIAYANATDVDPYGQDAYNHFAATTQNSNTSEHIYDTNAYATPEQTPLRATKNISQQQISVNERPRVSQLIQTFNSKLPE